MNEDAPALRVEELSSGYGGSRVLSAVSLEIGPGEILALIGKNGMGKSTLARTIMGLIRAQSGRISYRGRAFARWQPSDLVRAGVSYAPQEKSLFQDLSERDNLRLAAPDDTAFRPMLDWVAAHFPLFADRLAQKAGTLSGGEQKMLLLSRALMVRPRLVIVDEITEGLQPSVVDRIGTILRREAAEHGTAFLLIEQHIAFAIATAHCWAVLKGGEIQDSGSVGDGTSDQMIAHLSI